MSVLSLLHDTHVLLLMADRKTRGTIERAFVEMGATVHAAKTQNEAIGLYWRLFRAGVRPRVVVTSWSLTPQDSTRYKYLEMLGRQDVDGTALNLLVNIVDLDPTAFLTIYTSDPVQAAEITGKAGIATEVFSKHDIEPIDFVIRIATHQKIGGQRVDQSMFQHIKTSESQHHSSCEFQPYAESG